MFREPPVNEYVEGAESSIIKLADVKQLPAKNGEVSNTICDACLEDSDECREYVGVGSRGHIRW